VILKCDLIGARIVTRLPAAQPKNLGSIAGRDKIVFSSLKCPDWLWVPSSLLLNVYLGPFPTVESGPDVKLTINLHLVRFKNGWSDASTPSYAFMVFIVRPSLPFACYSINSIYGIYCNFGK